MNTELTKNDDIRYINILTDIAKRLRKETDEYTIKGKVLSATNAKKISSLSIEIVQAGLKNGCVTLSPNKTDTSINPLKIRQSILSEQIGRLKFYGIYYDKMYFNIEAEDIIFKILLDNSLTFENSIGDIEDLYFTIMQREEFVVDDKERNKRNIIHTPTFKSTYYNTLNYLKQLHPEIFEYFDIEWMIH